MRRLILLLIPVLITTGLLAGFWMLYASHQPPVWQPQLDKYIAYQAKNFSSRIDVIGIDHASAPWELVDYRQIVVYGDSVYYKTDINYGQPQSGALPLPKPPVDVYCILLTIHRSGSSVTPSSRLVYAVLYQDIYNADWVIQEVEQAPSSAEVLQMVSRVGCSSEKLHIIMQ